MGFKTIIKNADQQKNYMREVYSKFWSKSRKKYGFEQYDKDLIKEFSNDIKKSGEILEVGIGGGIAGIAISEILCREGNYE